MPSTRLAGAVPGRSSPAGWRAVGLATVGRMRIGTSLARGPRLGIVAGGVLLLAVVAFAACGGDDGAGTEPSVSATLLSAPPGPVASTSTSIPAAGTGSSTSTASSAGGSTTTNGRTAGTVSTAVGTAPTTPATAATGVPGGSSDTPMCRDYATVVGSQSVLTIVGAFGDLGDTEMARLELIAAPSVMAAAQSLATEWPSELAAEQAAVESAVIGPITVRAQRALAAVQAAGLAEAPLVTAWQTTLATWDPALPDVTVAGLGGEVEAGLATAAATYASTATRYDRDPSVLRTAPTPLTTAYLFDRCPELSYLIAGDAD
jgi:hypothetical protein